MAQTETDISQLNLKEPEQIDYENYETGGTYVPPPIPVVQVEGKDGKLTDTKQRIVFRLGPLPKPTFSANKNGYLQATFGGVDDPIAIEGSDHKIRFANFSVERWKDQKTGEYRNASPANDLFKGAGLLVDPQSNSQYESAFLACEGRVIEATLDLRGYNKDTQESVDGYANLPIDPATGQRKLILSKGDKYTNKQGQVQVVKADVIFMNAQIKRIVVPK